MSPRRRHGDQVFTRMLLRVCLLWVMPLLLLDADTSLAAARSRCCVNAVCAPRSHELRVGVVSESNVSTVARLRAKPGTLPFPPALPGAAGCKRLSLLCAPLNPLCVWRCVRLSASGRAGERAREREAARDNE